MARKMPTKDEKKRTSRKNVLQLQEKFLGWQMSWSQLWAWPEGAVISVKKKKNFAVGRKRIMINILRKKKVSQPVSSASQTAAGSLKLKGGDKKKER